MSLVKLFQIVSLSLGISLFSFLNSPIILSKTITDSSTTEQCTDDNSTIVEEILGSNQVAIDYCINEYVKCVDAPWRAKCADCLHFCRSQGFWPTDRCPEIVPAI